MTDVEKRNVEILKESGFWEKYGNPAEIHAVIDMVRADERERAAQVCDKMATPATSREAQHDFHWAASCCSAAIRSRDAS